MVACAPARASWEHLVSGKREAGVGHADRGGEHHAVDGALGDSSGPPELPDSTTALIS